MAPQLKVTILHARGLKNVATWGKQDPAGQVQYNGQTWNSQPHKAADTITIKMLHKSKVIGSSRVTITEAHKHKVAASTQLEDDNGYGVGTVEYEVEVTGGGFSQPVRPARPTVPAMLPAAVSAPLMPQVTTPYQTAPAQNPYAAPHQLYKVHDPYPAAHHPTASTFPAPVAPGPIHPVQPATAPLPPAHSYNPLSTASAYPTPYPDFSTAPAHSSKYPGLPPTCGSAAAPGAAALYPDFSTGFSGHGQAPSSPNRYQQQQQQRPQHHSYPAPAQQPSAPPMPGTTHDRHTPSYHLAPGGQQQHHASSSAGSPPAGYPIPGTAGVSRPPPLSNGPTPPSSPPEGGNFHPPPPKGYPRPNHGAPPSNLSRSSTGTIASTSTTTSMHANRACGAELQPGSMSARYPQPPAAPGCFYNRSVSMPQQAPSGGGRVSESNENSISGSPRRVVGAYGNGAYTDMRRQTAPDMSLYHPYPTASSPLHAEARSSHRYSALSGLAPQKEFTEPTAHSTPGYALYEG